MAFPGQWAPGERQGRFIQWLRDVEAWRQQAAMSAGRYAYEVDWGPVLTPALLRLDSAIKASAPL